jgi:hypothetical protein
MKPMPLYVEDARYILSNLIEAYKARDPKVNLSIEAVDAQ